MYLDSVKDCLSKPYPLCHDSLIKHFVCACKGTDRASSPHVDPNQWNSREGRWGFKNQTNQTKKLSFIIQNLEKVGVVCEIMEQLSIPDLST